MTGTESTVLIVLRGPSGAGKSTTASALRERYGRGLAIVRQDVVRRDTLKERDITGAINVDLIGAMTRQILDAGVHCVVEGIMTVSKYGQMLDSLVADHIGRSFTYYWELPFQATVERHHTKPNSSEWSVDDMREWYVPHDTLATDKTIGPESTLQDTVARILADTRLLDAPRPTLPSFQPTAKDLVR